MLDGVMLLWFLLTALSLLFVVVDIRTTPASPVLKWGFILLTAYTGPLGAFLYVLGCREPLPGLHERYVATRWRQVLGSTMHCVAGDGVGILAGAVIASLFHLPHSYRYCAGVRFGLRLRMEYLPISVHAGHGGWFIYACALQHFLSGVAVYELPHGRHGAGDDFGNEKRSGEPRSLRTGILVHYVHGPACWFHHRVSDELVVGIPTHEARHDDGATTERVCKRWST